MCIRCRHVVLLEPERFLLQAQVLENVRHGDWLIACLTQRLVHMPGLDMVKARLWNLPLCFSFGKCRCQTCQLGSAVRKSWLHRSGWRRLLESSTTALGSLPRTSVIHAAWYLTDIGIPAGAGLDLHRWLGFPCQMCSGARRDK